MMVFFVDFRPFKHPSLPRSSASCGYRVSLLPTQHFRSPITFLPMETSHNISPILTVHCLLNWYCPAELSMVLVSSTASLSDHMTTSHKIHYLAGLKNWICDSVELSFKFNWLHEPSSSLKVSLSSVPWRLVPSITQSQLVETAEAWTGLDLDDIPLLWQQVRSTQRCLHISVNESAMKLNKTWQLTPRNSHWGQSLLHRTHSTLHVA